MPLLETDDEQYLFAIDDANDTRHGRKQWVIYGPKDANGDRPVVIDRHGLEAGQNERPPVSATDPPVTTEPPPPSGAVIRVTDAQDGDLLNRMYSYWSSACLINEYAVIFVGHADGHPRFFQVDLRDGRVTRLGSLLPYTGTAEGWSWTKDGWIMLIDGARLRRVNPFTGEDQVVLDISATFPGCVLWQPHSSDDGRTHSATIQQPTDTGPYVKRGTAVFRNGELLRFFAPVLGELDESAISANGRYLMVKEGEDDDNRIFDLEARTERVIRKAQGALGHSDCGPDWAIGDDRTVGGATWINLANPDERRVVLRFPDWNMGHVSVKAGRCLLTHGSLIVLLNVDNGDIHTVAEHGMVGSNYDHQVMANLSPDARVACWMSNVAGRMDAYMKVL